MATTQSGFSMHGCLLCGGVFLDTTAGRMFFERLPHDAVGLASSAASAARYTPRLDVELRCPVCQDAMKRVRAERAGVDLDKCEAHGTFYDREELSRVAAAIQGAGWGAQVPYGAPRPAGASAVAPAVIAGGVVVAGATAVAVSQAGPPQEEQMSVLHGIAEVATQTSVIGSVFDVFSFFGDLFN
ncbi:MAG: zf-TFIIB domain-containing protein [Polyangiaceae bacterium]